MASKLAFAISRGSPRPSRATHVRDAERTAALINAALRRGRRLLLLVHAEVGGHGARHLALDVGEHRGGVPHEGGMRQCDAGARHPELGVLGELAHPAHDGAAHGVEHRLPGGTLVERLADLCQPELLVAEEGIELRGEVAEERARRHVDGSGDVLDGARLHAALGGELDRCAHQLHACALLLALAQTHAAQYAISQSLTSDTQCRILPRLWRTRSGSKGFASGAATGSCWTTSRSLWRAERSTGLLGPSGSGKTTLMRAVVGVQIVERGRVAGARPARRLAPLRARVGYVTQAPSVYADLTAAENLRYSARVVGAPASRIDDVLATVDFAGLGGRLVRTMSGGERSRVSLAVALLSDPELLVFDEPTVGLDPVLRRSLWETFHTLAENGRTLLVSTHVMDEADRSDDLVLMRDGRVVAMALRTTGRERPGRHRGSVPGPRGGGMSARITATQPPSGCSRSCAATRGHSRSCSSCAALIALLQYVFDGQPQTFDRVGGPLLGLFPFISMFLVTSIAVLRERTSGTLERLMSVPTAKLDLLGGYALAFALVATVQASLTAGVSIWLLDLDVAGPVWLLVALAIGNALLGMALGLFMSAFAQTEFQAVQAMPAFVLPQLLLSGLLVPREGMAPVLEAISWALPLTYAFDALARAVADAADALAVDAAVVIGSTLLALALGAATLRRRTA